MKHDPKHLIIAFSERKPWLQLLLAPELKLTHLTQCVDTDRNSLLKRNILGGVKILVNAKYRGRFMFWTTKKIEEAFFDAV